MVYDAEVDALLEDRLAGDDHVIRRAWEGHASVALDESGRMIECRPDGSAVLLDW